MHVTITEVERDAEKKSVIRRIIVRGEVKCEGGYCEERRTEFLPNGNEVSVSVVCESAEELLNVDWSTVGKWRPEDTKE